MLYEKFKLSPTEIKQEYATLVERYGPWIAIDLELAPGLVTMDEDVRINTHRARAFIQTISDLCGGSLEGLRVLDLACLEGYFALEFALHGAKVVGIEGREANVEKAKFMARALGLDNAEFYEDDVRNLSVEKYGHFDIVLCAGILYHLDTPDVFELVENVSKVCRRYAIFNTHFAVSAEEVRSFQGHEYRGRSYVEHHPSSTPAERMSALLSSLDNPGSFWLTRPSLYNLITQAGFNTVLEVQKPFRDGQPFNFVTLLATKGAPQTLLTKPGYRFTEDYPESEPNPFQQMATLERRIVELDQAQTWYQQTIKDLTASRDWYKQQSENALDSFNETKAQYDNLLSKSVENALLNQQLQEKLTRSETEQAALHEWAARLQAEQERKNEHIAGLEGQLTKLEKALHNQPVARLSRLVRRGIKRIRRL